MEYTFHFGIVWDNAASLLDGAWLTVKLSAIAMVASLVVAILGAFARTAGPRWLRRVVAGYVEAIRNTPFLVQIFLLYFGLSRLGVHLDPTTAGLLALVLNGSAYTIEIVRAGIEAVGPGQIEAAAAIGLHRLAAFRLVVLPQAMAAIAAPLGGQFILLMLNSSITSVISAEELTATVQDIGSRTFHNFEANIAALAIYFVLSSAFGLLFDALNRRAFGRWQVAR